MPHKNYYNLARSVKQCKNKNTSNGKNCVSRKDKKKLDHGCDQKQNVEYLMAACKDNHALNGYNKMNTL